MDPESLRIVIQALARIPPFEGMDETVLVQLVRHAGMARMPAGTVLFRAGDPADRAFILIYGEVGIYRNGGGDPAAKVGAGEVLGTAPFLAGERYPATAATVRDSLVLYIPRHDFARFAASRPGLLNYLKVRLEHADACARVLARETPAEAPLPEEFYYKAYRCPACAALLRAPAVRSRFVRVAKTDSDFCQHYEGVNPLLYEVVVCPACGYAFNEESNQPLNPQARKVVREFCAGRQKPATRFPRTLDDAVELFRLAVACQEAHAARPSLRGRLYLKLAWLCRYRRDTAAEGEALANAVRCFEEAFQLEPAVDPKQELNLLYLLGELNRRLGRRNEAARWFARVLGHPEKAKNPLAVNMARDRWQEMREHETRPG